MTISEVVFNMSSLSSRLFKSVNWVAFIRSYLLGRRCQVVFVRSSLSGRLCQVVFVRSSLSGRLCQFVFVRSSLLGRLLIRTYLLGPLPKANSSSQKVLRT